MPAEPRAKVAVLISGRGSNMAALCKAANDPAYPAEIALVISNAPEAGGLEVAAGFGVETLALDHRPYGKDRAAHEAKLDRAIRDRGIEWIALAGYMRVLTPGFVEAWAGRMINIHPSLLPSFPGLDTHRRALEAGVKLHGCTCHFVTAGVDEGPIIGQAAVPVLAGDTESALAARVLKAEHRLYAAGLAKAVGGVAMASDAGGMLLNL